MAEATGRTLATRLWEYTDDPGIRTWSPISSLETRCTKTSGCRS